jgi:ParB family chromosome partitioning protein
MVMFRGQMVAHEGELAKLRQRLEVFDGAMPARRLDPARVVSSRWENRHKSSFSTPNFARLKTDIQLAGGNVQPILVRPMEGSPETYEIVFGHRRHRACSDLGIPVLAIILTEPLSDLELFAAMDRENRERADLSPWEQGTMYQRALDDGLYPSMRQLGEALGVSHTWIRKATAVAQLPQAVIECFRTPLEVQYRHAEQIAAAIEKDRRAVLKRAEKLRGRNLSANEAVAQLVESASPGPRDRAQEIRAGTQVVGRWSREKTGAITIRLSGEAVPKERIENLLRAIAQALE